MQMVSTNGAQIPALGFGTWPMRGRTCSEAVTLALETGYRHIDTAQAYGNEPEVGVGVLSSGVPRRDIFLTTKVRPERVGAGSLQQSIEESCAKLATEYVDLTLIHWPNPAIPVEETIEALCDARRRGLTRHIGVSNFTIDLLDRAVAAATEPLVTEQVEYHPYVDQRRMLAAIRRHGLAITAYCPVALGRVAGDPVLAAIGERHGKTPAQVALRWLVQQGDVIAIPKSSHPDRIRENFAIFDFVLDDGEMAEVEGLRRGLRLIHDPGLVPRWDD